MQGRINKTKILLISLSAVLFVLLAVIAFLLVSEKMQDKSYAAALEKAEKYLAEGDYEQAVLAYEEALSLKPESAGAYLALASLYMDEGYLDEALDVLDKGYTRTESRELWELMEDIQVEAAASEDKEEDVDLETASEDIAWDVSFIQKLIYYTYDDYKDEFGSVTEAEKDDDGYLAVRHEELSATCYYKNTDENKDLVSGNTPANTAMPEKVEVDSLNVLFRNFDGGASLERMQLLFGESVKPKTDDDMTYIEDKSEDIVVRLETDEDGNIVSEEADNEILLPLANSDEAREGTLRGVVVDAVSGKGVKEASLTFKPEEGSEQQKTTTNDEGVFTIELSPGDYEVSIEADGYISEEFTYTMEEGENTSVEQFVLSPELSGEARIVLEWGSSPSDLDSHLTGYDGDGNRVHVSYRNRKEDAAELDLDDTNGYGPETTTILDLSGDYTFSVDDFRNTTGTIGPDNPVTVKIYLPGADPVEITLEENLGDNYWTVCKINNGKLEIIDEIDEELQR